MLIEGRFMRNLRTLLLLVICLGTVQYLIGSYVLNLVARDASHTGAKADDVAGIIRGALLLIFESAASDACSLEVTRAALGAPQDPAPGAPQDPRPCALHTLHYRKNDRPRALSSRSQRSQSEMEEVAFRNIDNNNNSTATTSLLTKMEAPNVTQVNQDVQIVKVADTVKKAKMNVTVKANMTIFCDVLPTGLGPFEVNTTAISLLDVEEKYPEVAQGGYYKPPNCTARHKVALIVPYRDALYHLSIFLNNIHPFLMKQQIEYRVFIVEQQGTGPFNRGKLFNVGFTESRKLGYHCFVFHDVDLLPLDTRNLYTCNDTACKTNYFGSVNVMAESQFVKLNGYSNKYWNFGGEDEDMTIRLTANKLQIATYLPYINRYFKMNHTRSNPSLKRFEILKNTHKHYGSDGLSSLEHRVVSTNENHLYTHWMVDLIEKQPANRTLPQTRTIPFVEELRD